MAAVQARGELSLERGEGYHVFDTQGRRYLDATASLWYAMIGHGRGEIGDAVAAQMRTLEAYSTFGDLTNPVVDALIERIAALAPVANSTVFLTSGGSDSIETALELSEGIAGTGGIRAGSADPLLSGIGAAGRTAKWKTHPVEGP